MPGKDALVRSSASDPLGLYSSRRGTDSWEPEALLVLRSQTPQDTGRVHPGWGWRKGPHRQEVTKLSGEGVPTAPRLLSSHLVNMPPKTGIGIVI